MMSKQQINCSFLRMGDGGAWVGGRVVSGRHNCMILHIKTCFDKKVTLLALVPLFATAIFAS